MNNIKTMFTIRDLENLSGIKAHTIRIWEKRYNVLVPARSQTNIRLYDIVGLRKLLNIALLHSHGYKISKIASYTDERIPQLVQEIGTSKNARHHAVSDFKLAMMNFDTAAFHRTYNNLLAVKSFAEIFFDVFVPLLEETGLLWQSGIVTPAQEHFLSSLIKQKIVANTERETVVETSRHDRVFVLYLPMGEIHELGLLYVNYELLRHGYRTIYLGESVPDENVAKMKDYFDNITFVTYLTVKPDGSDPDSYVTAICSLLGQNDALWVTGRLSEKITKALSRVTIFPDVRSLVHEL